MGAVSRGREVRRGQVDLPVSSSRRGPPGIVVPQQLEVLLGHGTFSSLAWFRGEPALPLAAYREGDPEGVGPGKLPGSVAGTAFILQDEQAVLR